MEDTSPIYQQMKQDLLYCTTHPGTPEYATYMRQAEIDAKQLGIPEAKVASYLNAYMTVLKDLTSMAEKGTPLDNAFSPDMLQLQNDANALNGLCAHSDQYGGQQALATYNGLVNAKIDYGEASSQYADAMRQYKKTHSDMWWEEAQIDKTRALSDQSTIQGLLNNGVNNL